jgi:integrase
MRNNLSVLFYIRRANANKVQESRVYMRVTLNGRRIDFSTGKSVEIAKWSSRINGLKGNGEEARKFNLYLANQRSLVFDFAMKKESANEPFTINDIKNLFVSDDKDAPRLIDSFEKVVAKIKMLVGKEYVQATYKRYLITLEKLKRFIKAEFNTTDIPLKDLDYSFVARFEYYLKTEDNLANNTAMKYIKNLKKVIHEAQSYGWIDNDPFVRFKCSYKPSNRTFLTQEELDRIEKKDVHINRLDRVKDIFLFSCYTGLAYSEIERLSTDHLVKDPDGETLIKINRKKTNVGVIVPLLPQAAAIIKKYEDDPLANYKGTLLPVTSNQKINAFLKEIAVLCDISKNLTFHMARHTFATTVTLSNGVPIETVSKILGHTSIKTTQIYGKIVDLKVSEDMRILRKKMEQGNV